LEIGRTWRLELEVLSKRFKILEQESEVLSNFKIYCWNWEQGNSNKVKNFTTKWLKKRNADDFKKGGGPDP
jgi:hypothetical protein